MQGSGSLQTLNPVGTLILDFAAPRSVSNKFLLFTNYPVFDTLFQHHKWTNIGYAAMKDSNY